MQHTGGHDRTARAALCERAATPELLAELALPAYADALGLARLATLHVAGLLGVPVGRLAELRLAVHEACALLVHPCVGAVAEGLAAGPWLRLRFARGADRLRVEVRGPAPYRGPGPGDVGWVLLRALADEVRMATADGITTLTLLEPLPAA